MEAIKVLSGLGEPLLNVMVTYDLRDMSFFRRKLRRNPSCPLCGHLFLDP
jgi:adenylyltransferase/sulfurtransferase